MTSTAGRTDGILSLADVRPGDLVFTSISEPLAASILVKVGQLAMMERVRIGTLSVDHVLVVTESRGAGLEYAHGPSAPKAVQAMPRGAEEIELTEAKHWKPGVAFVRIPEDYPGQGRDAAAIAQAMIGTPYSFPSYAMLAAWRFGMKTPRLEARINRRRSPIPFEGDGTHRDNGTDGFIRLPAEAICSVLADQTWSLAGKRVVEGVKPQCVTPGALAMALWRRPGVIWGGPGILG